MVRYIVCIVGRSVPIFSCLGGIESDLYSLHSDLFRHSCKPKSGPSFQTGQCDCETCHLGTFTPGRCGGCFCPAVFIPVCCNVNGKDVTKGNSCECGCAGGKVVSEGICKNPDSCKFCPGIVDTACCKRKKDGLLFEASNKCTCECEGTIIGKGKCPAASCATVKCANCVDTIDGPKCSAPTSAPPTLTLPPLSCANVLCAVETPCCIENGGRPRCVKTDDEKCSGAPPVTTKPPKLCPCPKILRPTCCKSNTTGLLFTAANECICKCDGTIIGPGKCPAVSCANVRCAGGPCVDTVDGPKCQPPKDPPKSTCRNVKCGGRRPCCIETKRGPKCVHRQHRKCPSRVTCRTARCTRKRPCCIETWRGPKCVHRGHPRCRRYR